MPGLGKHRGMGIDKLGDGAKDIDFNKQVRKAKVQPADESIIDGVTHDSIAEFVASQSSPGARTVASTGLLSRLRRKLGR